MRPRFHHVLGVSILACACKAEVPTGPTEGCAPSDDPVAELAQADGWGLDDGTPVQFGIPPQGGAPFAPFVVRLIGMPASTDGYHVVMTAFDRDLDAMVGEGTYDQRFVCANVGENTGTRVASEFHMRFFGYEPAEIVGHEVDVEVSVEAGDGTTVSAGFTGPLDWVLGPMGETG